MILSQLVSTSALLAPSPSEIALEDMVKNARAANLFAAEGNTISSPANVLMVTIMMAQAVDAGSRTQILQSLHPQMTMADGRGFFQQLAKGLDPETTRLARAVWSVEGATPAVQQGIKDGYGAEVGKLPTQEEANDWASRNTSGMIRQFPIQVANQKVILASALAYTNQWKGGDKPKVQVPFQFGAQRREIPGFSTKVPEGTVGDVLTYHLPYENGETMLVLLGRNNAPTPARVARWGVAEWKAAMQPRGNEQVFLHTPNFQFQVRTNFMQAWKARGRPIYVAFPGLYEEASNVFFAEGAYVRVDEKGTKAASLATIGGGGIGGGGPRNRTVVVDRPFVFAIVRPGYPLPLFIGTVNAPAITP
jgi:serine protease inhibitor